MAAGERTLQSQCRSSLDGLCEVGDGLVRHSLLQLFLADAAGEQALRAQKHDADQDQAEYEEVEPLHLLLEPGPAIRVRLVQEPKTDGVRARLCVAGYDGQD